MYFIHTYSTPCAPILSLTFDQNMRDDVYRYLGGYREILHSNISKGPTGTNKHTRITL